MFGSTDFLNKVFKPNKNSKSRRRELNRQRKRFTTMQALEDRRVLAAIYDADFSTTGAGFADHTTSSPPVAGPAASGPNGALPNQWTQSYATAPSTDGSANEFSVNFSSQFGSNAMRIQDWGDTEARFESQNVDVSSLSTVSVDWTALGVGTDAFNASTEFLTYFYRLDGGSDVDVQTYDTNSVPIVDAGTSLNFNIPSLNVAGVNNLTVGFRFLVDGGGDGFEVGSIVVDDLGGGGAAGVTVTPSAGSNDVAESGATSDTFDVVLNTAPTSDVTITLATPDGETTVSPSTLTFTPANFATPQSVTVTAVDDSDEEGAHTGEVTLSLSSVDSAYDGLAVPNVTANISDNDVTVDLIITGVVDGPLTGGTPKAIELFALNRIDDLSVYGINASFNGGTSNSSAFLSGSVNAGNYIYVTTDSVQFDAFFGSDPTEFGPVIESNVANVNGDDVIQLFKDVAANGFDQSDVVDVYGELGVDGTGQAWEYLDGWAYRDDLATPATTFATVDWTISGIDVLDGETSNATATTPFPIAAYKADTTKQVHILSGIDGTSVVEGGSTGEFGVVLNVAPSSDVTITLSTTDGETMVSPTTLTFTPANFATPQVVTVTAVNDTDVEGGHTGDVTFAVTSADSGYNGAVVLDEPITITDDDATFAINEVRISHSTLDDVSNNFVEIYETSGASNIGTAGLHLLVLSGEFSPGSIDFAIDLSSGSTDGSGFMLIADDGTTASVDIGDILEGNLDFFGSPTTFLLVSGFTGTVGTDLDAGQNSGTANDGTLDETPWTAVLDAVSLDDADATPDQNYATAFGGPTVFNPAGNGFTVAAISARPDGSDSYEASVGLPSDPFTNTTGDTPGFSNVTLVSVTQSGDYTGVTEGGAVTDTLEFVLDTAPTADVTITLSTADGQTTVSSSTITFTPANFSTPQFVTVTAVDDALIEGSPHSGIVGITVSSTDPTFDGNFVPDVNVAIGDNDGGSGSSPLINEFRTSHMTLDNASNNFIEIHDTGSTAVGNLSLIVISERFAPGVIDFAFNLVESGVAGATDASGFFLLHDNGFNSTRYTVDTGDVQLSNVDFFGSASTYLLVDGFHGAQGLDLDDNNDGFLDSTPWTSVIDAVTIDDANFVAAGYGNTTAQFLTLPILPNVPSAVRRRVDGGTTGANGGFDVLQFNDDNADTPGSTNVLAKGVRIIDIAVAPGDLNGDLIDDPGTQADLQISENGVTDSFGVVLDAAPTANVTITFTTADGETTVSPVTFTPSNWFVEQTVTVSAVDDTDIEGNHVGVIGLSITSADAGYSSLTPPSLSAEIIDNDAADNRFSVIINEIHSDPAPLAFGPLAGDANGDGVTDSGDDEFIEIVNTDSSSIDISGWTVSDSVSVRHVFPASTVLLPGQAVVVFGGGIPTGSFGGSVVQTASTGLLGFGSADSAILSDGTQTIDQHSWAVDDGIDDGVDNSMARIPNFTGDFIDQGSEDGFVTLWTPGVSNVLPFSSFALGAGVVVTQTGNQAVTEGGAGGTDSDSFAVALSAAPTSDVTITIGTADGETSASVATLTFTPANFATPQIVTITAVNDLDIEGGHTGTITLSAASADASYNALPVPDVTVDITDNDVNFQINEIRVSHTSLDNDSNNFLEIFETGGNAVSLNGLSLVVIRSEAFGANTAGEVVTVYSLDGGVTDSNGFLLIHDDGFAGTPDPGDLSFTNFDLIGGPMTYVVVSGFTGITGQDLDDGSVNFADDGVFDATPWNTVIDSITLDDIDGDTESPTPTPTLDYSAVLGGTKIDGLGDTFVLAAASAIPDGSNTFVASAVDPFNDDSGDTPGATNVAVSAATIAGRHIYYNDSFYDGNSAGVGVSEAAAIDPSKTALLPGGTATFANYTGYTKGINGIMVDLSGATNPSGITVADFEFRTSDSAVFPVLANAPAPLSVTHQPGGGVGGSDRYVIIWSNNAIQGEWLQVTVLANANTGLALNDVHYWGNAPGDTGNSALNSQVNGSDVNEIRLNFNNFLTPAAVDNPFDIDKNRLINGQDVNAARLVFTNFLTDLNLITVPSPPPEAPMSGALLGIGAEYDEEDEAAIDAAINLLF